MIRKPGSKKQATKRRNPGSRPSEVGARSNELHDWRSQFLARIRSLIKQVAPDAIEELKWKKPSNPAGVPVWSRDGIICTGETYKDKVKLTFAQGAALEDPGHLFNSSMEGGTRRAIDIREGDTIDEETFKNLVRAAVTFNTSGTGK